jgi:hypothetical protein
MTQPDLGTNLTPSISILFLYGIAQQKSGHELSNDMTQGNPDKTQFES